MISQPGFTPHVARIGDGAEPVLALHCTMAFSGAWGGVARAMEGAVSLIAPDMPSHGKSADWDGQSDFCDTVYEAALAQLSEPMHVIGHSFGAATALRLAIERPDLVKSATLFEPVFFCFAAADAPESIKLHNDALLPMNAALEQGDIETAARVFNRMWSDENSPKWDVLPEGLKKAMMRGVVVVPSTHDLLIEDSGNYVARVGGCTVPTLLLAGSNTHPVMPATNAAIASRMPHAQTAKITGAGHMAPITHPVEVAKVWHAFLRALG